jgi:hypothetical protein
VTADVFGPKRDRWGRYLLPDPDTGKERAWTRATTLASTLADTYGLTLWQMRMVAKGLGMRPDLLALAAAAHVDDKTTLDRVAKDAKEAAGSSAGANAGTALHSFTEAVDRGEQVQIPPPWDADVAAYRNTLDHHGVITHPDWIERIVVWPEYNVAGTLDRIVTLPDGRVVIGDVKTGKDLGYAWSEIAIQLALYANATHMWHGDHWEKMPALDPSEAVVFHVPVGKATCDLYTVDTVAGWEMISVAHRVRQWRGRRDLAKIWPATPEQRRAATLEAMHNQAAGNLLRRVQHAQSVDELVQLWAKHDADGTWTPELTAAAADRKRALTVVSASNPT